MVKRIAESKQTHGHELAFYANDVLCIIKVPGRYLSLNSSHLFLCISATLAASAAACLSHSRFVSSMDSCRRLSAFFCRKPRDNRAIYTRKIRRELYHLYEHVLSNKTRLS